MITGKQIRMLEQDVGYLWDEGFYTMSNRMGRILEALKKERENV